MSAKQVLSRRSASRAPGMVSAIGARSDGRSYRLREAGWPI